MRICYHGTSIENADNISLEGFHSGTWFAENLQDAIGFGGCCVFEVAFDFDEAPHWQFISRDHIAIDRIVSRTDYTVSEVFENKELRRKIFESNS